MAAIRDILAIIDRLAPVSGLKFVGGTSLFIQNKKETINDIDVLVQDIEGISSVYEIVIIEESLYKFQDRRRAYYIDKDIMIDVFVEQNEEDVILLGKCQCVTTDAQIKFLERTLRLSLSSEKRQETLAEIAYLKSLR